AGCEHSGAGAERRRAVHYRHFGGERECLRRCGAAAGGAADAHAGRNPRHSAQAWSTRSKRCASCRPRSDTNPPHQQLRFNFIKRRVHLVPGVTRSALIGRGRADKPIVSLNATMTKGPEGIWMGDILRMPYRVASARVIRRLIEAGYL